MDTTTLSVLGVDDAELARLLSDAGAPHDEVPRLLRRLRMYFLQGGSVDILSQCAARAEAGFWLGAAVLQIGVRSRWKLFSACATEQHQR